MRLIYKGLNFLAPRREPICPPAKTATKSVAINLQSSTGRPLENCPSNPPIEFTRIKTLANAEILFASAQFIKCRMGERKIPPPILTSPDKKPMAPPIPSCFIPLTLTPFPNSPKEGKPKKCFS